MEVQLGRLKDDVDVRVWGPCVLLFVVSPVVSYTEFVCISSVAGVCVRFSDKYACVCVCFSVYVVVTV